MISNRVFWGLVSGFILVKISLVGWWPFLALTNMPHDATLFLRQAMTILEGNWLGEYSEFTLMKGPMTAIWIALVNFLGIPLLHSHHLLYIAGCILCVSAFRRFTSSNGFLLFVFLLLLFNPYSYVYGPIASAFREMLHQPLVLGTLAVSITLLADFVKRKTLHIGLCTLFGLFLLGFWNNREEGVWILPCLCLFVLTMTFNLWKKWGKSNRQTTIKFAQALFIPFVIWGLGTVAIAWKNYKEYGVFAVVELKTPQFERAFGGLISIDAENWHPKHAAQPDVLDKLYSLSSGGELDLDGKSNAERQPIPSYLVPWTFRSAVRKAGYYEKGGKSVLEYYDRLGSEIETACAEERFACSDPTFRMLPPWHPKYTESLADNFSTVFKKAVNIKYDLTIHDFRSVGTPSNFLSIARLVNAPIRVDEFSKDSLPPFYLRIEKNKTRLQTKLIGLYQESVPFLLAIAILGVLLRLVLAIRSRHISLIDVVCLGLAGTLLLQFTMFTLLRITGYSNTTRVFFMFYPVFYTFIAFSLLSLSRDIRTIVSLFRRH